jgi:predicted transcriptional regulator
VTDKYELIAMATDIVSAYVGHNSMAPGDVPGLIRKVFDALRLASGAAPAPEPVRGEPAVPIKKSLTPDYLICLEDGKKFKSLKRHLRAHYDLSPEEYREKWNLPADYPMVAPNYAQARSRLAKKMGLGQQGRKPRRAAH